MIWDIVNRESQCLSEAYEMLRNTSQIERNFVSMNFV